MKFCVLTEDEFRNFSENHEQESFFQTVENANFKKSFGAKIYYLGVKKGKKIVAAGMFSSTACMFGKRRFYSQQGFLIDYHDFELLEFFTKNLKEFAKKEKAMFIKMDPNIIYQLRDINGDPYPNCPPDLTTFNNLKKLGYKHFGFTKEFRFTQSRWNFRVSLDVPYEELKKGFSKSTRKNIDNMYKKGVRVRRGKYKDLESMTYLLQATAERRKFKYRELDYYKSMYKYYGDLMNIYIAYVDTDIYLDYCYKQLEMEKQNNETILAKMEKDMVGNKLRNQLETSDRLLNKYQQELEYAKKLKEDYPNGKDVGGLLSIKSGKEYITLTSGILSEYKKFMPKYIMYNEHILDCYKFKIPYVDFYGISGNFSENDPVYGVYEFKKGFGGEVVELIGEFSLKVSNTYYIYNFFRHMKILYRKIIKR